jgi:hypothetical protein
MNAFYSNAKAPRPHPPVPSRPQHGYNDTLCDCYLPKRRTPFLLRKRVDLLGSLWTVMSGVFVSCGLGDTVIS